MVLMLMLSMNLNYLVLQLTTISSSISFLIALRLLIIKNCTQFKDYFISLLISKFNFSKRLFSLCSSSLAIYFKKTLVNIIERFYNICLFRLTDISFLNHSLIQQFIILKPYNLMPYKIRLFYKFNIFCYNNYIHEYNFIWF